MRSNLEGGKAKEGIEGKKGQGLCVGSGKGQETSESI